MNLWIILRPFYAEGIKATIYVQSWEQNTVQNGNELLEVNYQTSFPFT